MHAAGVLKRQSPNPLSAMEPSSKSQSALSANRGTSISNATASHFLVSRRLEGFKSKDIKGAGKKAPVGAVAEKVVCHKEGDDSSTIRKSVADYSRS